MAIGKRFLILPALVLALGIAACSPSGKAAPSKSSNAGPNWPTDPLGIAAYQKPDRQQMLESGAKEEGALVWYTGLVAGIQNGLVKGFEAKYPYIKVNVVRADAAELQTRVQQQAQAKKPEWDAWDTTPPVAQLLVNEKALAPYYSPEVKNYPEQYRKTVANNLSYWAMVESECIGFGYNANLLAPTDVPKTFQDLLNPALKGKMVIPGSSTGVNVIGDITSTQPNGQQLAQQIAKQQNVNVQQISALATLDLIASGEFAGSPGIYEPHIAQAKAKGAPVKWVALEPAPCTDANEVMSSGALHPHAALLWMDFLLGADGQKVVQSLGYFSPTQAPSYKTYFADQNISVDDYAKKINAEQQFFQQYFVTGH